MFDEIGDIKAVIKAREGDMTDLHKRMDDDYDLFSLKEYEPVKGYEKYTSASPRNHFDKVIDGLNRAVLDLRIRLNPDAPDKERDAATLGDQYLQGALGNIDRTLRMRGEPPLRQGLGFLMGLRGWLSMRALVYVPDGEKDTVFDVQPWDPRFVTWEQGAHGLIWAAFKRMLSATQIKDEYDIDIGGTPGQAEVIDFFDKDRNSIIVQDEFFKAPTDHNIGRVPVFIRSAGSMPSMQPALNGSGDPSVTGSLLEYRGDSVWHSSRGQYKPWNKYVSGLMDTSKKALVGSLKHFSEDGKKKLTGVDPHETFTIIPMKSGKEDLVPLEAPVAPPEVAALLRIIGSNIQQSTLPDPLSYGGSEAPESGRALAIRIEATRSVFNPYTGLLGDAYTWLGEELLSQFTQKGIKASDMRGFNDDGAFFSVKVKPKDINADWFVSASVEPRLPRDEQIEVEMAARATESGPDGQPLLSKRTAREDILKVRDADAEEDRILAEKGKTLPPIIARRVAAALEKQGHPELAQEVMALIEQGAGPGGNGASPQGAPPPIPEEVLRQVISTLVDSGNPQVAELLLEALGAQGGTPSAAPAPNGPVPAPAQQQAPPQSAPQEPPGMPTEVIQLIQQIVQVLASAGRQDLATQFVDVLQSGQAPDPTMIEDVIETLIAQGREDLAQALLQLLGVPQAPTPAGQGQAFPPKES